VLELAQGWLPSQVCPLEARELSSCDEIWIALGRPRRCR
jgi:hypothetical protein